MVLFNYRYNLSDGSTYSYQDNKNKNLSRSNNYDDVSSIGKTAGSASSAANIGSVGQLNFDLIIKQFENGNLTVDELIAGLNAKQCKDIKRIEDGLNYIYTFVYKNKRYQISCNKADAESQIDSKKSQTISAASLGKKFTKSQLDMYFNAVEIQNGHIKTYAVNKNIKNKEEALKQFIEDFTSGNLGWAQVPMIMDALGIKGTRKVVNGMYTVIFKYEGKAYKISCLKSVGQSGVDDKVSKTYTSQELSKYSDDIIKKYFNAVFVNGGKVEAYAFKDVNMTMDKFKLEINETDISLDFLFEGSDKVDGKTFAQKYYLLSQQDNYANNELYKLISEAISKIAVNHTYDITTFFDTVIKLVNKRLGKNATYLTKTVNNELTGTENIFSIKTHTINQATNLFKIFEEVLQSDALKNEYYLGSINTEIDNYGQGRAGDCWLLASLNSLNNSVYGQQIIKDAIEVNGDGTYSVTFKGLNKTYTFTNDEIIEAIESQVYSFGDRDVLLIELAVEKLHKEIKATGSVLTNILQIINCISDGGNKGDAINGGNPAWLAYYLTGYTTNGMISENTKNPSFDFLSMYNYYLENGLLGLCCTFGSNISTSNLSLTDNHAYTIVSMDIKDDKDMSKNTVTLVDPHQSDYFITMRMDEFLKYCSEVTNIKITDTKADESNIIIQLGNDYVNGKIDISTFEASIKKYCHSATVSFPKSPDKSYFVIKMGNYQYIYTKVKSGTKVYDYNEVIYYTKKNYQLRTPKEVIDKFFEPTCGFSYTDKNPYYGGTSYHYTSYILKSGYTYQDFLSYVASL